MSRPPPCLRQRLLRGSSPGGRPTVVDSQFVPIECRTLSAWLWPAPHPQGVQTVQQEFAHAPYGLLPPTARYFLLGRVDQVLQCRFLISVKDGLRIRLGTPYERWEFAYLK